MRLLRFVIVALGFAFSLATGAAIGSQSAAQGITPIPGRHSEVHTLFHFYVKDTPSQSGWRDAEFKDEGGRNYYKADVLPGCGEWVVAPGTQPGLLLTPGGVDCAGFKIDFGALYWFSTPPIIVVTPSPVSSPFTGTVTPPPDGATATPSPTVVSGATVTPPSPPGGTPTPTRSVTGTPKILHGNMCEPDPTPVYPHSITIYGQGGLTEPAFYWWCQVNVAPDLVIIVPIATWQAAYDNGPRQMLQDLGR